jgi:hypothetical protein
VCVCVCVCMCLWMYVFCLDVTSVGDTDMADLDLVSGVAVTL